MTTAHKLIPTTNPNYAVNSGLLLEIKHEGAEHWTKLRSAQPYMRNKEQSITAQIKQLEDVRDHWISHGTTNYRNASYRIGEYKYYPELKGYAFEEATKGS